MNRILCFWILLTFFPGSLSTLRAQDSRASSSHLVVSFASGDRMLLGYLYRPKGDGPFPAVIFHHRDHKTLMEGSPARFEKLAKFYTGHGYILLLPDRHPDQFSEDEYSSNLQKKLNGKRQNPEIADLIAWERQDIINRDIVASLSWLQRQPDVNTNRIVLTGMWAGAMQSLIGLERINVSACVLFSPANSSWKNNYVLQGRLLSAARKTTCPILLIFSRDQNLEAAEALNGELQKKGKPNELKIYGEMSAEKATLFPIEGTPTWGPDVLHFLQEVK